MLSPQATKTNSLVKSPSIPKVPKSVNSSPRNLNLTEISIQISEKSPKTSETKSQELNFAEDASKSLDSKSSQETSLIHRQDINDYCLFLEHLISYEQSKTEIIIQKTKFPKVRMNEVEKILLKEFPSKATGPLPPLKPGEGGALEKFKKDSKDLVRKIKKNLIERVNIPKDTEELLETSFGPEGFLSLSSLEGQSFIDSKSFFEDSKFLADEKKKYQEMYESLNAEHKKLTGKYTYLISKFNKQDTDLKKNSRTLQTVSKNLSDLKQHFLQFVCEINTYFQALSQKFSSKSESVKIQLLGPTWNTEKEALEKKCENLKQKSQDLEKKLKKTQDELNSLKAESDSDSLDLTSNITDMLEIQKLKDQIRLLSFKSYESSTGYQKDLDSYKSQISKLRSQNFALEERIKSLNQKFQDLHQEKEKLLDEISRIHPILPDPKPYLSTETLSLGEASDNSGKVSASCILAIMSDEIEEIVNTAKSHNLFVQYHDNNLSLLRKAVEFLVGLKEDMMEESRFFEEVLEGLVKERKSKVFEERQELDVGTNVFLKDKEVEIYRVKLKDKKGQLEMMRKQNDFLKRTVKDLQAEAGKGGLVDVECLKGVFGNVCREIPMLTAKSEQMILVMMKSLGFLQSEIAGINVERRSKCSGYLNRNV